MVIFMRVKLEHGSVWKHEWTLNNSKWFLPINL